MNLFNVYPLYDITPVKALDCTITDEKGIEYFDDETCRMSAV